MIEKKNSPLNSLFLGLLFCLPMCVGCGADKTDGAAIRPKPPETSLTGMTVEQLVDHIKKHHGMAGHALVAVMGESAYEIFAGKDKASPALVTSWTSNDEGESIVDQFAFTKLRLPPLDDEDAVVAFCEKLLGGKDGQEAQAAAATGPTS